MKTVVRFFFLVFATAMGTLQSPAATKTWSPQLFSFWWSNPDNWEPSGVPQDGDTIHFEARPLIDGSTLTINDLTNLTVRTLSFRVVNNDSPTTYDWTLTGNQLIITHGIVTGSSLDEDVFIKCPIKLGGNAQFTADLGAEFEPNIGLHLDGPIDLNGYTLRLYEDDYSPVFADGSDLDVTGVISGSGNILIEAGSVEIKGEGNTYVGTMTVAPYAEVILNKSSGLAVTGGLIINTNGLVNLDQPHQIADTATVVIAPAGELRLDGHTETISGLSIREAPIDRRTRETKVNTGGATLSVTDNVTAVNSHPTAIAIIQGQLGLPPGNHVLHMSGSQDFALHIEARIIGEGGFTKMGSKGLLLSGNNSFAGDVVLQEGWLEVNHNNGLGANSGGVFMNGAELAVRDAAIGNKTMFVNAGADLDGLGGARFTAWGVAAWAGPIFLNTNLNVHGMTMTFSGPISGPGGIGFFAPGTGTGPKQLGGTAANTYTGPTLARAALLELNKPPGVQAFGGPLIVGDGNGSANEVRWLQNYQKVGADVTLHSDGVVNLNDHREDFGPVTFNAGAIYTGSTGELGIYGLLTVNPSSGSATIDGRLGLPPGVHEYRVNDGGALPDLRINATMLGTGHMRKTGVGQLWLAAASTYSGITFIDAGTLSVLNPNALGAATGNTVVSEGATLDLNALSGNMTEPLALRGTGDGGVGALTIFGLATLRNPFPSIYAAIDLTTNTTINVRGGSLLTVDGFISGIGPLRKTGAGTLLFANPNANIYSGDTIVADGTLDLAKPSNVIAVPGDLIVGPAPLNSATLVRWSQSGALIGTATLTANGNALLDLNGFFQTVTRLNLNDGADVQTGVGALSFPVGGTVNVGSLDPLGSHFGSSISGTIGLPPNASLTFAVSTYAPTPPFELGPELYVSAVIPPPVENPTFERAGLFKTGPGRMQLVGNNSYRGWTDVAEGALIAAGNNALGVAFGGTYVFNHATLEIQNSISVANENVVLNSTAAPALFSWAGDSTWGGLITLMRDSTIGIGLGSSLTSAGTVVGTGHLTKTGAGVFVFHGTGHNTFSGETFVNEGALFLAKPVGVTAVPSSLNIGTSAGLSAAVLSYSSYQVIGNIFINRNGILNLAGHVENVDHLWLSEGGDVETGSGILFLKTGGSIQVVPNAISDPAVIAGYLDMDAGGHVINVGSSTGTIAGPNLEISALMTSSLGSVNLQKNGTGTLRLSANNTYSGATIINAGTLQADGTQTASSVEILSGARLMGGGRVGAVNFLTGVGSPGMVSPGASPGILSCGTFNGDGANGVLRIELNGSSPGSSGHDQLWVRGNFTAASLAGLALNASLNFASAVNDQFTIVRKDGTFPVTGEFNGLPEAANFYVDGEQFTITYAGGDGNDVVLMRIPTPPRPRLVIEEFQPSAVRLLWPASFTDFTLQFSTNLSAPNWTPALPAPTVVGTNNAVINPTDGLRRFYRLTKP